MEEYENIFDTAIRESNEELGVIIEPERILAETELSEFDVKLVFILCKIKKGKTEIKDFNEIEEIKWMEFSEFFNKFQDNEIGHGLIWLRKNLDILKNI